jgi:hypothetical protein
MKLGILGTGWHRDGPRPEHYLVLFAKLAGLPRTGAVNIRVVR